MWLFGDFNDWNKYSHPFKKLDFGKWRLTIPPGKDGACAVKHLSKIKLVVKGPTGEILDRCGTHLLLSLAPICSTFFLK